MPDQPNPPRYTAYVQKIEHYSATVMNVTLVLHEDIHFKPGQFVNVSVAQDTKRQYSIASSPSYPSTIHLIVDTAPGGPGSTYFSSLTLGSRVELSAPLGRFTLASETGTVVFLSASTGIAPFKSMIDYLLEKKQLESIDREPELYLYQSFRYEKNIFWHNYFSSLEKLHYNFHYLLTLSQPSEAWNGCQGYVQSCVDKQLLKKPDAHFYICGGNTMVQGVLAYLRNENVPEDRIHFEPF